MPAAERPIDAVIDHAANLQQQVDQLSREVALLAFAAICLSLALMGVVAWLLHDGA
jgi:hypothetical protein